MRMRKWIVIILALAVICLAGCSCGEDAAQAVSVGSIVTFGRYEQDGNRVNGPEPIEWIVLDGQGNQALLLSRYALETKPYHQQRADITWEQCTLRTWLNADFINIAFNEQEQAAILMTHVDNSDAQMFQGYSYVMYTTGGNDTEDRVFLLSYHEAFQVYFSDIHARRCAPTDYAIGSGAWIPSENTGSWVTQTHARTEDGRESGKWWLRTPGSSDQDTANCVDGDGGSGSEKVDENGFRNSVGVRPAMWIDLGAVMVTGGGTVPAELTAGPAEDETDVPVTGKNYPAEPTAAPSAGETGVPLTGENQPAESTWAPQPIETARPAEPTPLPQPIETARPAEPVPSPQPIETARPAESAPLPQPIETARPAEPAPLPQPAETARPDADSRTAEPTRTPEPVETDIPAGSTLAPSDDATERPALDGTPYYETFSPDWWEYYVPPSETDIRIITFGRYEQDNNPDNGTEPIEWIVLEERNGKALLLSRYGLDTIPYNTEDIEVTWETCSVRAWLNSEFRNTAFNTEEQKAILLTDVDNSDFQGYTASMGGGEGGDYVEEWIVPGGNNTRDQIFLLSYHEAFEQYCISYETRMCVPTEYALSKGAETGEDYEEMFRITLDGRYTSDWWLRSLGESQFDAVYVTNYGSPETITVNYDGRMIRPAMWISMESEMTDPADETPAVSDLPAETANDDIRVGSIVTYGSYEQDNNPDNGKEPIEWIVLDVQDGKALLLSKYGLDARPYDPEEREGLKWENCSLRAWMNSEFMNTAFTEDEQNSILLTDVNNVDDSKYIGGMPGEDSDGNHICYDMPFITGDNTQDYIFLLSFHEAYDLYIKDIETRKCYPTEYLIANVEGLFPSDYYTYWSACWWIRTTVSFDSESFVGYVFDDGEIYDYCSGYNDDIVIRPAMWISLGTGTITPDETLPVSNPPVETPAVPEPPAETPVVPNPPAETANDDIRVGSIVTYGSYEQDNHPDNGAEPIEWIVLDVQGGKALLLSRYALDAKPYNTELMENASWKECSLRAWLNNDFISTAFSGEDRAGILLTEVNNSDSLEYEDHDYWEDGAGFYYGAVGGDNTQDYIFLLSCYEADLYAALTASESDYCEPTNHAVSNGVYLGDYSYCSWWLRTPAAGKIYWSNGLEDTDGAAGYIFGDFISFVRIGSDGSNLDAVRPAMWIDLTSAHVKTTSSVPVSETDKRDPAAFRTAGNIVTFGRYEQDDNEDNGAEPIEWVVLEVKDGKALLLSRYGLDCLPYHESRDDVTWETCSLRRWLNTDFVKAAFNKAEWFAILSTDVDNSKEQGIAEQYSAAVGNNTWDRVFLLSYYEMKIYFAGNAARACSPTAYAVARGATIGIDSLTTWWLRSPGGFQYSAEFQFYDYASESEYIDYEKMAVRPAMWVDLNADIFD